MLSAALLDTLADTTARDEFIAQDLACDGADAEYLRLVHEIESAGPVYTDTPMPAALRDLEPPF